MTKHTNAADIANALDVDEYLLYARVFSLTPEEQTIFEVCGRFCIGVGTVEAQRGAPPPIRPVRRNSLLLIA
jgi:hypothetical protein